MPSPAEAAKNTVELGKKHIIDQRFRIERQRKLIAELKRDAHPDCAVKAVRTLGDMEKMLAQMEADYAGAQERLAQATQTRRACDRLSATLQCECVAALRLGLFRTRTVRAASTCPQAFASAHWPREVTHVLAKATF